MMQIAKGTDTFGRENLFKSNPLENRNEVCMEGLEARSPAADRSGMEANIFSNMYVLRGLALGGLESVISAVFLSELSILLMQ